jgi:hypothetical protein
MGHKARLGLALLSTCALSVAAAGSPADSGKTDSRHGHHKHGCHHASMTHHCEGAERSQEREATGARDFRPSNVARKHHHRR